MHSWSWIDVRQVMPGNLQDGMERLFAPVALGLLDADHLSGRFRLDAEKVQVKVVHLLETLGALDVVGLSALLYVTGYLRSGIECVKCRLASNGVAQFYHRFSPGNGSFSGRRRLRPCLKS